MSTMPVQSRPTDDSQEALVRRLKSADESVLEDVLRTFGPRVEGLLKARHPFLRPEDCEEFLLEALYRLWQAREQYDPAKGSLQGWFFSIAENLLRDRWKRKKLLEHLCDPTDLAENELNCGGQVGAEEESRPSPEAVALSEILTQLTDLERRIILAHALNGGYGQWAVDLAGELAEDFGVAIRPGTIRVKRIRIHDKIKKQMRKFN
jgi:RNA polymerase sigma factor (sigma-70 family)